MNHTKRAAQTRSAHQNYSSDVLSEEDEDEDVDFADDPHPSRLPNSNRIYTPIAGQQVRFEYRPGTVIQRRSSAPAQTGTGASQTEDIPQVSTKKARRRHHWLLYLGLGMLCMLALWTGLQMFLSWWLVHTNPAILAEMEQEREEDNKQQQSDQDAESEKVVYIYPLEGGGVVFTETPIDEDEPGAPNAVSAEPETDQRPIARKDPPYLLHFLLLLLIFVLLDSADTSFTTLLSPTVSITVISQQQAITAAATLSISTGPGDVQGRILPTLTLSQSQTVTATGKGHQDALIATGTLNYYNGSFSSQTIGAGTIYTGNDGVQVATNQTITIAAAKPPYVGQATISASAIHAGASGNIQAGDISITTSTLQVRNSQFSGGQDARDFTYVTRGDIQQATSALTAMLLQSEQGALNAQLHPKEALTTPQCTPRVFSNHKSGDEAASVQVTVSETCKAIAYSQQSLRQAALQLVHGRLAHLNTHYQLIGAIQITIRLTTLQNGSATLTAMVRGVWVYQINEEKIKTLVAGKPRRQAIQLLSSLPGVERVSIAGISDNSPLPDDLSHIHLLIFVEG